MVLELSFIVSLILKTKFLYGRNCKEFTPIEKAKIEKMKSKK